MARAHHSMRDEPVFVTWITKMTGQAFHRARDGLLRRIETSREIIAVASTGNVDTNPSQGAAMTSLAAHPVRDLKSRTSFGGWYGIRVAAEAHFGGCSIGQTEIPCDSHSPLFEQHGIGAMVLVALRPDQILVLRDRRTCAPFYRAMTIVS